MKMNLQSATILCWLFLLLVRNILSNNSFSPIKNTGIMSFYKNTLRVNVAIRKLQKNSLKSLYSKYKEKFIQCKTSCESLYYDASYKYYTLSDEELTILEEIMYNIILS